jgi:hypothetical protein
MPKTDSLQGSLDLLILKILCRRPRLHGYGIMTAIQDISGEVLRAEEGSLIACANVANLMSAQAAARGREMALRISVGAGRARLIQLVLVESAMIALAAAAVGLIIAWQAAPWVVAGINPPETPARLSLAGDWRVFGAGLVLTLAITALSGIAPALRASAVRPAIALRGGEDPRSRERLVHGLVAVQVAFCFLVLFFSAPFTATFEHLTHQPAGFSVNGLLALDAVTPQDEPPSAWAHVAEHLRSVSGVESVALSEWPLLDGNGYRFNNVSIEGRAPMGSIARFLIVSPGWIDTMRIPLIEGRSFRPDEKEVAIVNREFVRKYFPGENPLGKWFEAEPGGKWAPVSGDRDRRRHSLPQSPRPDSAGGLYSVSASVARGDVYGSRCTFQCR